MLTDQHLRDLAKRGNIDELNRLYNHPDTTDDERQKMMEYWVEEGDKKGKLLSGLEEDILPPDETLEEEIKRIEEAHRRAPVQPVDSETVRNRMRAKRGNMLKKLKKVYAPYTFFSPLEAAERTKSSVYDMAAYLANEARLPGAQISYDEDRQKYFIVSVYF